jgi:hypothetical protein
MRRTLFVIITLAILGFCFITGCGKTSNDGESEEEIIVKTEAEYEAQAKEEITEDNMEQELANLEKQIEQELSEEP